MAGRAVGHPHPTHSLPLRPPGQGSSWETAGPDTAVPTEAAGLVQVTPIQVPADGQFQRPLLVQAAPGPLALSSQSSAQDQSQLDQRDDTMR